MVHSFQSAVPSGVRVVLVVKVWKNAHGSNALVK